jgi:hypothetical protein
MAFSPAIVFYSPQMEKVAKFYGKLGLAFVRERHGKGPSHYACAFDGIVIEIYPRASRVSEADRLRAIDMRLVFPVPDLDAALRKLRRLTKTLVGPKATTLGRSALIADPDGRHILLIETRE